LYDKVFIIGHLWRLVKKLKREKTMALGLTVPLTLEVADDENLRITIGVRYDIVPK